MSDSELPEGGDKPVLEPEEIEALMATMAPDEQAEAMFASLPPLEQPESVEAFDLGAVGDNGPDRYPLFVTLQERLEESIKEEWGDVFDYDMTISIKEMKQNAYRDLVQQEVPRLFVVYEVEGFGRMMLTMDLPLIVAHVDAMLGGSGEVFEKDIESLSPVELRLAERISKDLEHMLEDMWAPVQTMDFILFKSEIDPQFLAVAGANDTCFSTVFEASLENVTGNVSVHYPRTFLEPILESLRSVDNEESGDADDEWVKSLSESIDDVPVTLKLELGRCEMDVQGFLNLEPGDLLPLSKSDQDPATLWIGSTPMFQAQPGSQDGMLAVELMDGIKQGGAS
ncbi:MAG: FliM/FliN family flagellar motor switch protein [Mariprofundaceae bacterium]